MSDTQCCPMFAEHKQGAEDQSLEKTVEGGKVAAKKRVTRRSERGWIFPCRSLLTYIWFAAARKRPAPPLEDAVDNDHTYSIFVVFPGHFWRSRDFVKGSCICLVLLPNG